MRLPTRRGNSLDNSSCPKCAWIFSPTVEGKVDFLQKNFQEILKKLDRILESHRNQEDDAVGTPQFLN